jgi:hypothetical protein
MDILKKNRQVMVLMILTILIFVSPLTAQINVDVHSYLGNKQGFQGKLNLSLSLAKGEVDQLMLNNTGSLGYCKGKNAILLSGDLSYGKTGNSVFSDTGTLELRYGRRLSHLFSFELYCQLSRDKVRLIKQRAWIGGGFRMSFGLGGTGGTSQKQANSKSVNPLTFSLGAGMLYLGQKFHGQEGGEPLADINQARFLGYLSAGWQMNGKVNLTFLSLYLGALNTSRQYDLTTTLSLSILVIKNVSFTNTLMSDYDTTTEASIEKSHLQLASGLTWSF